jgi:hypothetical protein
MHVLTIIITCTFLAELEIHENNFGSYMRTGVMEDAMLSEHGAKRECFWEVERHFQKIPESEASQKRLLYIYIYNFLYIYCVYIKKTCRKTN